MRNRILGAIGVLWGGSLCLGHLIQESTIDSSSSYAAGQTTGLLVGGLMFIAGARALAKSFRSPDSEQ